MKRYALLAALALVGLLPGSATASHSWTNTAGTATYHWAYASAGEFNLQLLDNLEAKYDVPPAGVSSWGLPKASAEWNTSTVLNTTIVPQSNLSTKVRKQCSYSSGVVRVCNASYGRNGWLGIAEIYISGAHITQARVRMNDSYLGSGSYNNKYVWQHVLCQEVGHIFGLNHQYDEPTCMNDRSELSNPGWVSPGSHDYQQLATIYNHDDATTTVKAGAASQAQRKVTHVFWAPHGHDGHDGGAHPHHDH